MQGIALKGVMEEALSTRQMSVSALAREANVQRADIYRWWRGDTRPTRNSLARIAETLQVDTAVLRRALGEPVRTTETADTLITAIAAQTAAITELVGVLRPLAEEVEARRRADAAEAALRDLEEDAAQRARSVPREGAG